MENLGNDFTTTLASPVSLADVTLAVASGSGSPSVNFRIRIDDEYLLVTSKGTGTNWTVTRGVEGSTISAHAAGSQVFHVVTAGGLAQYIADREADVAADIHATTDKATPVDADELGLVDSAAAWVLKKLTWANLKAALKTYFDGLYPSGSGTSTGSNTGDNPGVTSVALSGSNGVSISGSPITGAGTIAVGLGAITPISVTALGIITAGDGTALGNPLFHANGPAASARAFRGQTANLNRWSLILGTNSVESGANAGSDLQLLAHADNGGGIDSPILITRASGGTIALGGTSNRPVTASGTITASSNISATALIPTSATAPPAGMYKTANGPALSVGGNKILECYPTGVLVAGSIEQTFATVYIGTGSTGLAQILLGPATPTSNDNGSIIFRNSNAVKNWKIGFNHLVADSFEIIPSTVGGGQTFSTTAFSVTSAGVGVLRGGLRVGNTSPVTLGNLNNAHVAGTTAATASLGISAWAADALGSHIELGKSRGAAIGTNTIVQNNDVVGSVTGYGANGSTFTNAAQISLEVDGTPGATNDMPGRIVFKTTPDGSGTLTTALTIDSTQATTFAARANLKSYTVGTLPAAGIAGGVVYVSDAGGNGPCIALSDGANWKRCDNTSTTVT